MEAAGKAEWRVGILGRVAAWCFITLGIVVFVGGGAWAVWSSVHGDLESLVVAATFDAVFVPMALGAWRWGLHPFLRLDGASVLVRNPYGPTKTIPRDSISGCTPGYSGLSLATASGETVAWAVQKTNIARWLGRRTRADDVCDSITGRRTTSA